MELACELVIPTMGAFLSGIDDHVECGEEGEGREESC